MSIYSYKQVLLTGKKGASIWVTLVLDKFAFPLTWFLGNFTRITPNQITVLSLFFAIISSIFFMGGDYFELVLGSVLFEISFFLDCVDGKLARLKKMESKKGEVLEFIRDKLAHLLNLFALSLGVYNQMKDSKVFLISLGYLLLLSINWLFFKSFLFKTENQFPYLTTVEVMAVTFFIGPALNKPLFGIEVGIMLLLIILLIQIFQFSRKS